jgi:histidinol-phosphate phosphatase family protein
MTVTGLPDAVLFDRDGTLVEDVPYNGDPTAVVPLPGAAAALRRLRLAGVRIGLVSNQSGVGRGYITDQQVGAVNRRLEELVGAFDVSLYCPHTPDAGCDCRKPAPGLVLIACEILRVEPSQVVVIGDIEADRLAAERAGATAVLVPNDATRADEVARAPRVAATLSAAVDLVLAAVDHPLEVAG